MNGIDAGAFNAPSGIKDCLFLLRKNFTTNGFPVQIPFFATKKFPLKRTVIFQLLPIMEDIPDRIFGTIIDVTETRSRQKNGETYSRGRF